MRRRRLEEKSTQWEDADINTVKEMKKLEGVESLESWIIMRGLEE